MKYSLLPLTLLLVACEPEITSTARYDIIPAPQYVEIQHGVQSFIMTESTPVAYAGKDPQMQRNARFLGDYLKLKKIVNEENPRWAIIIKDSLQSDNPEAYQLTVTDDRVIINGASPAGVFYGIQTLRKSIVPTWKDAVAIPAVEINDAPRFGYRGAHMDPCRHFFTVAEVKEYIDMMVLHNMNRLHWHLSEDQGWRLEIKKWPKLTEVGAKRPNTVIGHVMGQEVTADTPNDGIPVEGFYTQDDAREIIRYAAERYITVIPEIDLPGHMVAALTAYPELGCTGGPYEVWRGWGISDDILCAGKDETLAFLDDVLTEVADLFPSEYIHVGGDEAPKERWQECPRCQARIKALGLKDDKSSSKEEKLQSFITNHVEATLTAKGKKVIGWDEILEGGISPTATVMSWRGVKGGIEAARLDHDVIMTPTTYLYFDYYQVWDRTHEPDAIGGFLPLQKVYSYEPLPAELTPEEQQHIVGVQGNLWTEYIPTLEHMQYMALPRWAALAEIQWSSPEKKDYHDFFYRLPYLYRWYRAEGYLYAKHIYEVNADLVPQDDGSTQVTLYTADDAPIRYTLDGSAPTAESLRYDSTFVLAPGDTLRAIVVRDTLSHELRWPYPTHRTW